MAEALKSQLTVIEATHPDGAPVDFALEHTKAFCERVDDYIAEQAADPQNTENLRKFMFSEPFDDVLMEANTPAALSRLFATVDRLEAATRMQLGGSPLLMADGEIVRELVAQHDPALFSIFLRTAFNSNSVTFRMVEQFVQPTFGTMATWRSKGQPKEELPDFLQELAGDVWFATKSLHAEVGRIAEPEAAGTEYERNKRILPKARAFERVFLNDVLGVDAGLSRDFRLAIQQRTMLKGEDDTTLPIRKGGGVDLTDKWQSTLERFAANIEQLGVDRANQLYEECGIINFDRYTIRQLETMSRLINGDPEVLERLRKGEITLAVIDALGDHNGALGQMVRTLDNDEQMTLFFEIKDPEDFLKPAEMLATRFGLKASKLYVGTHGQVGVLGFGRPKQGGFAVATPKQRLRTPARAPIYRLVDTQIARLIHEYMQPDRTTGIRSVIVGACLGAAEYFGTPHGDVQSMAEAILRHSLEEDNVVVSGAEKSTNIRRVGDDLEYVEPADDKKKRAVSHQSTQFQWGPKRTVVRSKSDIIPGLR